jgi:hypothetical protein
MKGWRRIGIVLSLVAPVPVIARNVSTRAIDPAEFLVGIPFCRTVHVDGRTYRPDDRGDNPDTLPAVEAHRYLSGFLLPGMGLKRT